MVLAGCASAPRTVSDEPTPKEEGAPDTPPVEAAAVESAPAETPAQAPAQAAAPAPPVAPPPAASGFIPTGKPVIVGRFERVQFPAWVERAGIRASIKSGWAVYTSDRILTGTEGRVEIATVGEGRLKVGGDGNILFTEAFEYTGGAEPSLFQVVRGPFQFSSPMASGTGPNNGATIVVGGAINAIVLGGQVVGRVDAEESLLGLVDAVVRVSGPKLNPGTMREGRSFLRVPRQGRAQPVSVATSDRMARWLSAAQGVSGRPALSADGVWDVSLNSGYNRRQLEDMACRIQRRGIASEIYPVKEPGKLTWYRVVVRRFATKGDAVNFMST
ncbi:MAG: SPOR domain-containing protein, partial [Pseudomonadota bacterium]